jgi:SAM-dependent methyltransferase
MVPAAARAKGGDMTTTHEAAVQAVAPTGQRAPITPDAIMQIASGFMASKLLFAASELGVFEALAEGPVDLDGLAARTGLTRRATHVAADAMVALGLVDRRGADYANGPVAATFLAGATPADLRPLLRFWDQISYPSWTSLAATLGRGRPDHQIFEIPDELKPVMSAGIDAATAGAAQRLAAVAGLPQGTRLLDVGGGTGSFSIILAAADPTLSATVLELPDIAPIARDRIAASPAAERVDVVSGDMLHDEIPHGYGAFLLANVIHYWAPETNVDLLRRLRSAAVPGSRLLLVDFWTDATHSQPVAAALMAGEFAAHIDDGDVYSVDECREWLENTGWRFDSHVPLAGPISLVTAEAP